MRTLSVLGLTILSISPAIAPARAFAEDDPAPAPVPEPSDAPGNAPTSEAPTPEPTPAPPAVPPVVVEQPPPPPAGAPSSGAPPINITITNTNTNTNPVTTTNTNTNPVTTTTTATATASPTITNTQTVAPPPIAAAPAPVFTRPTIIERYTFERPRPAPRWITLGAVLGDGHGARGSIDLLARGAWTVGVAGSIVAQGGPGHDGGHGGGGGGGDRPRGTATAYLARTGSIRGFDVRAQLGLGVALGGSAAPDAAVARSITPPSTTDTTNERRAHPLAEAALLVGRPISAHWAITAGPVITATGGDRGVADGASGAGGTDRAGRGHDAPLDLTVFAGLRYRL